MRANWRQVVLPGQCRDPGVVFRDGFADFRKFRLHLAVTVCRGLIREQQNADLQEVANQRELFFSPLGAEGSVMQLTKDNPGYIKDRSGDKMGADNRIIPEMRDDYVGVE